MKESTELCSHQSFSLNEGLCSYFALEDNIEIPAPFFLALFKV